MEEKTRVYTKEELVRLGCEKPIINTSPQPKYCMANQDYGMTIGVAVTHGGRIFVCWVGGGDSDKAFFLVSRSDDKGESFTEPFLVIDPHSPELPCTRSTIVGNLWVDPDNRLWLFFNQSLAWFDGTNSNWFIRCDNPDAEELVWTEPQYISWGCSLNKPLILSSGEWLLPVSLWKREYINMQLYNMQLPADIGEELDDMRMANIFSSKDKGNTWVRKGGVVIPDTDFDEHMFVEKEDKSIWLLARTRTLGLQQSFSYDGGATWTTPQKAPMQSVCSRFNFRRLKSGNLLLIKHGKELETAANGREWLTAFLSEDDGNTWSKGFVLDERSGISYPDSDQDKDGNIYITYDRNRDLDGEIIMARLTEDDIISGRICTENSFIKRVVRKPGKLCKD